MEALPHFSVFFYCNIHFDELIAFEMVFVLLPSISLIFWSEHKITLIVWFFFKTQTQSHKMKVTGSSFQLDITQQKKKKRKFHTSLQNGVHGSLIITIDMVGPTLCKPYAWIFPLKLHSFNHPPLLIFQHFVVLLVSYLKFKVKKDWGIVFHLFIFFLSVFL